MKIKYLIPILLIIFILSFTACTTLKTATKATTEATTETATEISIEKDRADEAQQETIKQLIEDLNDENMELDLAPAVAKRQEMAMEALAKIGEPAVEPLIEALKHVDSSDISFRLSNPYYVFVASTLGNIGDKRAIEPLIEAFKNELIVFSWVSLALNAIGGEPAVELLIESLDNQDLRVIAETNDYYSVISLGLPNTEAVLIEVLSNYGNVLMAETFLNCGNVQLEKAGGNWIYENGYVVTWVESEDNNIQWGTN